MYLQLLVIALAAALSPIVISAFTRVAFTERRAATVPAFVGVVAVVSFLIPLIVGRTFGLAAGHDDGDDTVVLLDVLAAAALAVLLLALAAKNLRKRGTQEIAGASDAAPTLGLRGAFGLGLAVVLLNPKSLALFFAAGDVIGTESRGLAEAAVAAAFFAAAAAGPIGGVAIYQAVGGETAASRMVAAEQWMDRNGPVVKAVVLGAIGLFFAVKAITGVGKL